MRPVLVSTLQDMEGRGPDAPPAAAASRKPRGAQGLGLGPSWAAARAYGKRVERSIPGRSGNLGPAKLSKGLSETQQEKGAGRAPLERRSLGHWTEKGRKSDTPLPASSRPGLTPVHWPPPPAPG